jgi:hypothetical protein
LTAHIRRSRHSVEVPKQFIRPVNQVHIHTIQVSKSFYRQLTRCEKARAVSPILYKGIILRDCSLEGAPPDRSGGAHCNLSTTPGALTASCGLETCASLPAPPRRHTGPARW